MKNPPKKIQQNLQKSKNSYQILKISKYKKKLSKTNLGVKTKSIKISIQNLNKELFSENLTQENINLKRQNKITSKN